MEHRGDMQVDIVTARAKLESELECIRHDVQMTKTNALWTASRTAGVEQERVVVLRRVKAYDHIYERVSELEDDPSVPRTAYISTESRGDAEGGGLIGGLLYVGGALALWVEQHHADYLQDQLDHSGLLLWVRTRDWSREEKAVDILRRHAGEDVRTHDMPVESYTSKNTAASDLEKALLDPTLVFAGPKDVLARDDYTREQQRAVLQRWAYDARELEVAESEGMVGGEPDVMDQVKAALRVLDEASS